ncbi:hypothetical protein BT69DRAFT_1287824, partial [Atractiella rhizophila]
MTQQVFSYAYTSEKKLMSGRSGGKKARNTFNLGVTCLRVSVLCLFVPCSFRKANQVN